MNEELRSLVAEARRDYDAVAAAEQTTRDVYEVHDWCDVLGIPTEYRARILKERLYERAQRRRLGWPVAAGLGLTEPVDLNPMDWPTPAEDTE